MGDLAVVPHTDCVQLLCIVLRVGGGASVRGGCAKLYFDVRKDSFEV